MSKYTLKGITLYKDGIPTICNDLPATPVPAAKKSNLHSFNEAQELEWQFRRFHCSLSCPRFRLFQNEKGNPYAVLKCGSRDMVIEAEDLTIETDQPNAKKQIKLGGK